MVELLFLTNLLIVLFTFFSEKANRRCILAEKESDSVSVTTSILINPNQENIPKVI